MKAKITVLLAMALVVSTAFAVENVAETTSTSIATMTTEDGISSKGFRIGIVKPILKANVRASLGPFSTSASDHIDEALGFSLGYANLPVQQLGWTTNATYIDIKNEDVSAGIVRVDGNLAYAFTPIFNIKGGLNISQFTSDEELRKLNAGIGFQSSIGVQLTKNIGLDIGYTHMSQSGSLDGVKLDVEESGFEIGLTGTF